MGVTLHESTRKKAVELLKKRIALSAYLKTAVAKYRRVKQKQRKAWAESERSSYDGGRVYDRVLVDARRNRAVATSLTAVPRASGVLLVTDLEYAGWSPYADTVMELCTKAVEYEQSADGSYQFHEKGVFTDVSKVGCVNPHAVGHAHLDLEALVTAQPEHVMVEKWVDFLRRMGSDGKPMVFVAHGAATVEVPILRRALGRAGIDSVAAFAGLNIVGFVDTLAVSERLVSWQSVGRSTDDTMPQGDLSLSAFAAVIPSIPIRKKRVVPAQRKAVDYVSDNEGVEAASAPEETLRHGMAAIYQRLFDTEMPGAHQAEQDVAALVKVVTHAAFWSCVAGQNVVMSWAVNAARADELYQQHLNGVRGWRLEEYMQCMHGPMMPKGEKDAKRADGWKVVFRCRQAASQCSVCVCNSHPTFVPPPPKATANGTAGACTCSGMCQRSCPCKSDGETCTEGCKHKSSATKCTNHKGGDAPRCKKRQRT
jgi:hypothetical protein